MYFHVRTLYSYNESHVALAQIYYDFVTGPPWPPGAQTDFNSSGSYSTFELDDPSFIKMWMLTPRYRDTQSGPPSVTTIDYGDYHDPTPFELEVSYWEDNYAEYNNDSGTITIAVYNETSTREGGVTPANTLRTRVSDWDDALYTVGTYNTLKTEICTQINDWVVTHGSAESTDYNVLIFRGCENEVYPASEDYDDSDLFVIYYRGNDPDADEIIEI